MQRFERMSIHKGVLNTVDEIGLLNVYGIISDYSTRKSSRYDKRTVYGLVAAVIQKEWQREKCPYYRLYPGVVEAFHRLDYKRISKLDFTGFPEGILALEFEIPKEYWDLVGMKCGIISIGMDNSCITSFLTNEDRYGVVLFSKDSEDGIYTHPDNEKYMGIILGVISLSQDSNLLKPVVLAKDKRKFEETGDVRLIEKARRRGVFGFDVGEDIPTRSEFKKMLEENSVALKQGQKAPHVRCSYMGIRWSGKGKSVLKLTRISSCVINKDLLTKIPQGYYEK